MYLTLWILGFPRKTLSCTFDNILWPGRNLITRGPSQKFNVASKRKFVARGGGGSRGPFILFEKARRSWFEKWFKVEVKVFTLFQLGVLMKIIQNELTSDHSIYYSYVLINHIGELRISTNSQFPFSILASLSVRPSVWSTTTRNVEFHFLESDQLSRELYHVFNSGWPLRKKKPCYWLHS